MLNIFKPSNIKIYSSIFKNSRRFLNKEPSHTINVTGLSEKVLVVPSGEVGPGASKAGKYKNPEYFSYHKCSYFEAEIELLKYRLPQPSNKMK